MYLPNEIVVAILKNLQRKHLKTARLVCKTWCSYASEFLFDQIYVAPNRIDLEVFDAITQHPTLSKCVRRLIYDDSEFVPRLRKEDYVQRLHNQTCRMTPLGEDPGDISNPQISAWVHVAAKSGMLSPETIDEWKDTSLINRGYQVYQNHADYQQKAFQSGDFVDSLVQGLSRLGCLECVALDGKWAFHGRASLGKTDYGTPLARRWNWFHCIPHRLCHRVVMLDDFEYSPDGMRYYCIITAALARAQRQINEFVIGEDCLISPNVFNRYDSTRPNVELDIAALSGIKRLHLRLMDLEVGPRPGNCINIERLAKLLGSMRSLQLLYLDLGEPLEDSKELYKHEQIFPQAMTWDNLESIRLDTFVSSATNLLSLLAIQMPHLKRAVILSVQLKEGGWESVIECLKQSHHWTNFALLWSGTLHHHGGNVFEYNEEDVRNYVMLGGRHPCLSEDQPDSASEAYMLQIDASLRDRLMEMKSSRDNVSL